jgi:thiosulfate reductase cytochrome b subunit
MGGVTDRAFPGWITLPGYQDLADGRRWHIFFSWVLVLCGIAYFIAGFRRKELQALILRRADLPKLLPMQLYYFRLRKEPPPYDRYNPLQKMAYTIVLFVFTPLIVLTGLALSPGIDAIAAPLTAVFGGRQFARLWHFVLMIALIGFVFVHISLVASTGVYNNLRSMIIGK